MSNSKESTAHPQYPPNGISITVAPFLRDPFVMLLGIAHLFRTVWSFIQENRPIFTYLDLTAEADPGVSMWGPPLPILFLANLVVLTILVAGIGLLANMRWGWYLAEFCYGYAILRAVYMIVATTLRSDELQQLGIELNLSREYGALTIYPLLFAYFLTNRVLRSFGFDLTNRFRLKAVAGILAAALLTLTVTTLLSFWIISTFGQSVPWIDRADRLPPIH